jgi:hypothetical protein
MAVATPDFQSVGIFSLSGPVRRFFRELLQRTARNAGGKLQQDCCNEQHGMPAAGCNRTVATNSTERRWQVATGLLQRTARHASGKLQQDCCTKRHAMPAASCNSKHYLPFFSGKLLQHFFGAFLITGT